MGKYAGIFAIGLALGAFLVYSLNPGTGEFWQPALEDISFNFFNEPIERAIQSNQKAGQAISENNREAAEGLIQNTAETLRELKFYFVPLTEVRHLIYDADRLLHFEKNELSRQKLQEAQKLFKKIMESGDRGLLTACEEIYLKMDDLLLSYQRPAGEINQKFKLLFHRLNLMLMKGELELSGDSIK